MVRASVDEKIKRLVLPRTEEGQRFLSAFGIHRKIYKTIENSAEDVEQYPEEYIEDNIYIDEIDEEELMDFVQKNQVKSTLGILILKRKKEKELLSDKKG